MHQLDDNELKALTGYAHRRQQIRSLAEMGVKFRVRPKDGKPVVFAADLVERYAANREGFEV